MARIHRSEPNVFGYNNRAEAKNVAATTVTADESTRNDVNRDIINATKAIQASVANTNSNKTAHLVSGMALLVIAALAYQNHLMAADRKEMSDMLQKFNPGTGFTYALYDGGPSNELCLDILLSKPNDQRNMIFGTKFANFQTLMNKTNAEQVSILSEVLPKLTLETPNGDLITLHHVSRLRALILSHCTTTFTNFEHLLSSFSKEALHDALLASADVANYGTFKKIKDALKANGVNPKDIPFSYAMAQTDPMTSEDVDMQVIVKLEGKAYNVFDSQKNLATKGYVNPKAVILNGLFQQQVVKDEDYPLYLKGQLEHFLAIGDQNRLNRFLATYPAPIEQPLIRQVIEDLELVKTENGDWVTKNELEQTNNDEPQLPSDE